jgi:hypothetical protein
MHISWGRKDSQTVGKKNADESGSVDTYAGTENTDTDKAHGAYMDTAE